MFPPNLMFRASAFVLIAVLSCADCQICSRRVHLLRWVRETYMQTYRESYNGHCFFRCTKYRTRSYQAVRTVPRNVVEFRDECCLGYYQAESPSNQIKCEPICRPSCQNGYCKAPGQCACYERYQLANYMCYPMCDKSCGHGKCVEPNKCQCDFGYHLQNDTCEPRCTEPCVNATCIAPDTCECLVGYRKNENNLCLPYCSSGCPHGTCVSPDNCSCDDGWYKKENACLPRCDTECGGGSCIASNVCECFLGYEKTENGTCTPYCSSGCFHGTCVSPENCTCNNGYRKNSEDEVCSPVCDFDCGVGGTCSGPNVCDCHFGYEKSENGSCIPLCHSGCVHGTCFTPHICTCDNGWEKNVENDTCEPVCVVACGEGGTCAGPNVCQCHSGYKPHINGSCIPHCSNECLHGTCVGPENCSCDIGWHKKIDDGACYPVCDPSCGEGGTCISPNVCQCNSSYEITVNGTCAPHCSKGCPNGICVQPELCQCLEGWSKNELGDCEPNCDKPCGNGTCISPNICQCFNGYKLDEDNLFDFFNESLCIPECKGCNGTCLAPDVCSCGEPFEAKYVSINGGDCNCDTNCSEDSIECDHIVCVPNVNDWQTTTDVTDDNLSNAPYRPSIPYGDNDAVTDGPVDSKAVTEELDVDDSITKSINSTEMNESSSLVNSTKSYWSQYWIYIVVSVIVLTTILGLVLFLKRRALSHYFNGGAYPVEEEKAIDLSTSF
ncbi:platelet endothelial aggregation receptor 1-like [Maniola jurtina]|uniref:platelet endothelial aggregation receptor 1-like n=1 Tax=Maniola jurtina TaxID=191418 RepID=UPI001E688684|nr:platelet endothelial aggregation receptor 1-like [Maniola jurtina]